LKTGIRKSRVLTVLSIILIASCSTVRADNIETLSDSNIVQQDTVPKIDSLNIADIEIPDSSGIDTTEVKVDSTVIIEFDSLSARIADTTNTKAARKRSPAGAMWRSFFFPGWGQFYNRKYIKSLIIAGGEISLIAAIYLQEERRKDAKKIGDDYAARFYRDDRQRMTWWLAGVVLYSMADAYVDAQLADFDIGEDLSAGILPGFFYVRFQF
jgi:hypothetical protein